MITRATLSTIEQGLPKYRSMLAGNSAYIPTGFDSIATATATGGTTTSLEFTSIPSGYKSLHLRGRILDAAAGGRAFCLRVNGDTGTNYSKVAFGGAGGSLGTFKQEGSSLTNVEMGYYGASTQANYGWNLLIDLIDYSSTSKNKTGKAFWGWVSPSGNNPEVGVTGFAWHNTTAITSLNVFVDTGSAFANGSSIGLYGVR